MTSRQADRVHIIIAGLLCLAAALALLRLDPGGHIARVREQVFDQLLLVNPRKEESGRVAIVDIDRPTLLAHGNWPWPRETLAGLVETIASQEPALIAINVLLPASTNGVAEGDQRLAAALRRVPTVLAVVLDPEMAGTQAPSVPLGVTGEIAVPDLMMMPGAVLPAETLLAEAKGLGVISLPAPEGQPVRRVLLLAGGGQALLPGFAVETLRVAAGGITLIASTPPQELRIGENAVPLPADGQMRLRFSTASARATRTYAANDILSGAIPAKALKDKIVILGVSAPEAGGLRLTAADPFLASVQIEADAIETILSGGIPIRKPWAHWLELAAAALIGLAGIAATAFLRVAPAALAGTAAAASWTAGAALAGTVALQLFDPIAPAAAGILGMLGAAAVRYRRASVRRAAIERRFALHLSPEIVRRISENPDELKLKGEERTITALFADIEGFTATTERVGAERMVEILDRYVDTVASLVIEHGGMVDKIVGDGIVAFFNAPVDLESHTEKALTCALAIIKATEALREEPEMKAAGLGRTRIGIETGPAMLGDVGRGAKRNYTAMGRTVNIAARLEGANKAMQSSILVGPVAAESLKGRAQLESRGRMPLQGISDQVEVFTPVGVRQTET